MGLVALVAQKIFDHTTVNLANTTMLPCTTPNAELINSVNIHIPGPFGATVHPFKYKMSTRGCGADGGEWHCDNPTTVDLGHFETPTMHLKPGSNTVSFTAGATLGDSAPLLNNFIVPLFMEGANATLTLEGEDIDINVLKIPLKKLHMKNTMTCTKVEVTDPTDVPAQYCGHQGSSMLAEGSGNRRLYSSSGYVIKCSDHKNKNELSIVV